MQDSNTNNIISIDNLIQNQDIYYYRCGLYKNMKRDLLFRNSNYLVNINQQIDKIKLL